MHRRLQIYKFCIAMTVTNYTNTQYIYICICMQNTTTQWRRVTQFLEKCTSHFIWKGCMWEGVGDRTELKHFDPDSYGHQRFFPVLQGCSTGGPGAQLSAGCWLSLPHLVTNGLVSKLTDFLSSPSYIIVQRPPSCGRHNRAHSTRPRSRLYSNIP